MLSRIKVLPLAAESLGVRSMCTFVETPSLRLLLDAGVSLAPNRFGLPPHPQEFGAIIRARNKITEFSEKADVVTISHYHFDHHTPSFEDWLCNWTDTETACQVYEGKTVLAKSPLVDVNASQRRRGWIFEKTGGKHARKLEYADGKIFQFGDTKLKFSEPVFHGLQNTPLGWIIMIAVEYQSEKLLFASDVQGPMYNDTMQQILNDHPQLLIISGPPTYLEGIYVNDQQIRQGLKNLETLAENIPVTIIDHHLLRSTRWRESAEDILGSARKAGNKAVTAAEYLDRDNKLLEAKRKQLYEEDPPSREFEKWSKLPQVKRRKIKPPI